MSISIDASKILDLMNGLDTMISLGEAIADRMDKDNQLSHDLSGMTATMRASVDRVKAIAEKIRAESM